MLAVIYGKQEEFMNYFLFTMLGYLSGSILYACWLPKLICGEDIVEGSSDRNPGTANVFKNCGIFIGTLVLICELMKGFLPVFFARKAATVESLLFAPVLVAPVFGHAFPFLNTKKGGKAIAVSFGLARSRRSGSEAWFFQALSSESI